jgi:Zn-dependent peptidase ImmA (M78 family)
LRAPIGSCLFSGATFMGKRSLLVPFLERQDIELKAAELIRTMAVLDAPSDAFDIARWLGIPVNPAQFDQADIAGMLVREGARVEIRFRDDDRYERQNFTVAHELGHLTLQHPGTWTDTTNTMYRRSAWSGEAVGRRAEYQANLFAAALLMPEPAVRARWSLLRSIHYVAPYFRVSKTAIQRRLEELGLIIPTPKGVHFVDLSDWDVNSNIPVLPTLSDEQGPIPRFPPITTDEQGRIIPMSDEEWAARSSAMSRVLKIAGNRTDDESQEEG